MEALGLTLEAEMGLLVTHDFGFLLPVEGLDSAEGFLGGSRVGGVTFRGTAVLDVITRDLGAEEDRA